MALQPSFTEMELALLTIQRQPVHAPTAHLLIPSAPTTNQIPLQPALSVLPSISTTPALSELTPGLDPHLCQSPGQSPSL